jgi:hypothetical protein
VSDKNGPVWILKGIDLADKICDYLRCDFLPECYMAPTAIREWRRTLRYRNLLVRQMVQMKIKISSLLMEAGVSYNKQQLHKAGYFRELLATNPGIDEGLRSLLRQFRETVVRLGKTESAHRFAGVRSVSGRTRGAADEHSRQWSDHRADLGARNRRGAAVLFDQQSDQLLRPVRLEKEFR